MVNVVTVRHAFDAVPPSPANIRDGLGPTVAGRLHDVIDGLLFGWIGSSLIGEDGLRVVEECGRVRHDDGEVCSGFWWC